MAELPGYGKILDIDLSTGKIVKRDLDPEFARSYVGGMGFGCRILYDEVGPDVDPLGPGNVLVFANGPLTGTGAPCSGRTEITSKSPLTGSIATGNTGGMWGARLKHAGFDLLVVRGKAEGPVYLSIHDDRVELREAHHLWGKDTHETSDRISAELGHSKISVMAIGPAGENLVKYACPVNDYHHVAARGGAGAVMGAMKLKAIAVRGSGSVKVARKKEFQEAAKQTVKRILANVERAGPVKGDALPDVNVRYQAIGCLPYRNYQEGTMPHWRNVSRSVAQEYYARDEGTCWACPISCFKLVEVKDGKWRGVKVSRGFHPGVVQEWGARCAIDNLPAIWKCKELCHQLGMDYVSAAGVLAFAMELFQRGIITAKDTDGLELPWGNEESIVQTLHNIALRRGFGDLLAEGSEKAATRIGKGAEAYALTIKGMEFMGTDPRSGRTGWHFGELTNPRGGDNVKNTHFLADVYNPRWWIDEFDMFEDVKGRIYGGVLPERVSSTWERKAIMTKWFEDLYSVLNALGICFMPSGFNLAVGPTHLSKLLSAMTGRDVSPQEIMKSGEKIFTLLKMYTVRQGLTRRDDAFPERFYGEPLPEGPAKGAVVPRDTIESQLEQYYELRGWDKSLGIPTARKLAELGLEDLAPDLNGSAKPPRE
ncbi:MAG: aldehyde ferredoxin oxidoreductase family protein [Deltaproteobacteria bacterium]|nr:aldehyde ferredoxin oxidoreductase family protein [Deltaproteobacteria bacterium]